ncbi:MAG: molecular chaperone DnaJ [Actinomycetales bacterium mxb001]|nr:MAG: molecular chaperone DnaJ [Actinomycetales bacterium mxb001]
MATDYYAMLGVSREASPDEIKRAYRKLARELHPDVNQDPGSQERFKEVTAAYEVLSDPEKRQMYDLGGDPLRASGGGFGPTFDFSDLMDAFFGGGQSRGPRPRMRRGQDALIRMQVDLAEAMFGGTREIQVDTAVRCNPCSGAGTSPGTQPATCPMCKGRGEIQNVQRSFLGQVMTSRPCPQCQGFGTTIPHPCVECSGDGRVRTRATLNVTVPPGVDTGTRIQLAGQGEVGPGGGDPGDLFVEIVQQPHPVFERRGDDLHCTVEVPMTMAALGTSMTLETLDGDETVEIRPGTQPDSVVTLRARGVPRLRGTGRGDLHVHLDVRTPTRLDDDQEQLVRQLARARGEEGAVLRTQQDDDPASGGLFSRLRGAFSGR